MMVLSLYRYDAANRVTCCDAATLSHSVTGRGGGCLSTLVSLYSLYG